MIVDTIAETSCAVVGKAWVSSIIYLLHSLALLVNWFCIDNAIESLIEK